MGTTQSPTIEELKKYLQDADMYEENTSYKDMLSIYEVIKCSENTAQQENEQRSITEHLEDDSESNNRKSPAPDGSIDVSDINLEDDIEEDKFCESPASPLNKKTNNLKAKPKLSLVKSEEDLSMQLDNTSVNKENTEYEIPDSPLLKHKPLDIILYERKYDLPPYSNPKFNKLSISQRAKVICNFHRTILQKFYKLHCESINPAPWGKPIPASDKFSSILNRKSQTSDDNIDYFLKNDEENANNAEIYISRAGRQTKRKVYIIDDEDDNDVKKSKKDEDKPFESDKKPIVKRPNLNKLSNQDIMKRSKLFADSSKTNTTRTEKLFDLLKEAPKKAPVDQEAEGTSDSTKSINADDLDIIPKSPEKQEELESAEPVFIRRRVVSQIRGRRGIGRGKQTTSTDKTKSNDSSPSNSQTSSKTPLTPTTSSSETKQENLAGKAKCPICSEIFHLDKIEAHAATCGLLMETESNFETSLHSGNVKKIICEVCDKEMIMNKEYEVHVKECIQKNKDLDNA